MIVLAELEGRQKKREESRNESLTVPAPMTLKGDLGRRECEGEKSEPRSPHFAPHIAQGRVWGQAAFLFLGKQSGSREQGLETQPCDCKPSLSILG